jgi:hypothetical protein
MFEIGLIEKTVIFQRFPGKNHQKVPWKKSSKSF